MNILILGGYGNAGILVTELILRHTQENIILAGRNLLKAEDTAHKLNLEYNTNRVSSAKVDASDESCIATALKKVSLIIVASSTLDYSINVIDAAIEEKVDYFDLQLSSPLKLNYLKSREDEINSKGLCFITDGGFHPGLPAAMVRFSAENFDELQIANVYIYLNIDWGKYHFSPSTGKEMINEFNNYKPEAYFSGQWKKLKWSEYKIFDFGKSVGKHYAAPMMLEEMKFLPKAIPSLNETGFFVGGFNWFVNYISIPFVMISLKISESLFSKPAVKLFEFGLKKFSKPPYICSLKLKAFGKKNNKNVKFQVEVSHSDGYLLTAVPVVACLFQYLDGSVRNSGLHFQANIVEPKRFFKDLQMMGIDVIVTQR